MPPVLPDQRQLWEKKQREEGIELLHRPVPSLARNMLSETKIGDTVLELGCGSGRDAYFFASNHRNVIACDFSMTALKIAKNNSKTLRCDEGVRFVQLDLAVHLPLQANSIRLIYSMLALHYFSNEITKQLVDEIYRILERNGRLFAMVKSVDDTQFGLGDCMEDSLFLYKGHLRHFFTKEYALGLFANFQAVKVEEDSSQFADGRVRSFLVIEATK